MPTTVELPDKTQLEFPDGMDEIAMRREIEKAFPQFAQPTPSESASVPAPGEARAYRTAPVTAYAPGQVFPNPKTSLMVDAINAQPTRDELLAIRDRNPVAQIGQPIQPGGQPGTFTRGATGVMADIANTPELIAGAAFPPTRIAMEAFYGPQIFKQVIEDLGKAVEGDNEAAGRATAILGVTAMGLIAKYKPRLEYLRAMPEARAAMFDAMAKEAWAAGQANAQKAPILPRASQEAAGTFWAERQIREAAVKGGTAPKQTERPTVPGFTMEEVLAELRKAGANTKEKVQQVMRERFGQEVKREAAAGLRDQAFPGEVAQREMPTTPEGLGRLFGIDIDPGRQMMRPAGPMGMESGENIGLLRGQMAADAVRAQREAENQRLRQSSEWQQIAQEHPSWGLVSIDRKYNQEISKYDPTDWNRKISLGVTEIGGEVMRFDRPSNRGRNYFPVGRDVPPVPPATEAGFEDTRRVPRVIRRPPTQTMRPSGPMGMESEQNIGLLQGQMAVDAVRAWRERENQRIRQSAEWQALARKFPSHSESEIDQIYNEDTRRYHPDDPNRLISVPGRNMGAGYGPAINFDRPRTRETLPIPEGLPPVPPAENAAFFGGLQGTGTADLLYTPARRRPNTQSYPDIRGDLPGREHTQPQPPSENKEQATGPLPPEQRQPTEQQPEVKTQEGAAQRGSQGEEKEAQVSEETKKMRQTVGWQKERQKAPADAPDHWVDYIYRRLVEINDPNRLTAPNPPTLTEEERKPPTGKESVAPPTEAPQAGSAASTAAKPGAATPDQPSISEPTPKTEQEQAAAKEVTQDEAQAKEKGSQKGVLKEPEQGPGMADLGAAVPWNFVDPTSKIRHWYDTYIGRTFKAMLPTLRSMWNGRNIRDLMTRWRDWVGNSAHQYARQNANDIRKPMERLYQRYGPKRENFEEVAGDALSMVVEADGDPAKLNTMKATVQGSTRAIPYWKTRTIEALDFAIYHWDELSPLAKLYSDKMEAQRLIENAPGSDLQTLKRAGYVPHRPELDEFDLLAMRGQGQSTFFQKVRSYPTFAELVADGRDPRELNAADLMEHRLRAGMRLVNLKEWMRKLMGIHDPNTGRPVLTGLIRQQRANGSFVMVPPDGYAAEIIGTHMTAVLKGYDDIFKALTSPSWVAQSAPRRALLTANAMGKSISLAVDTFHLGRIAFWDSMIQGLGIKTFHAPIPRYKRGLTLIDYSADQIREMARRNEIPQEWLATMLEDKRVIDLGIKEGFNIGRISDALFEDIMHSIPGIGKFNRWIFEGFQRGAMAQAYLLEYQRARHALPKLSENEIARRVSRQLNIRFGNLGRQSWFGKSATARDLARTIFLAPQWNEGLIRAEVNAAFTEPIQMVKDVMDGNRLFAGVLMRSVGGMALANFVANQIINQATRGKFTWENPEEGFGAKLSAWIPDKIEGGPGFFLHPLGLAAEITHLITNMYSRSGGDPGKVAMEFLRSRSSAAMRPVLTLLTQSDFLGRKIKPENLLWETVKAAIPAPIAAKALVQSAEQAITGEPSQTYEGQYQKQAMASLGVRTERAPSSEQRIISLARDWNSTHGVPKTVEPVGVGDYQALFQALRLRHMTDAREAMKRLQGTRDAKQVQRYIKAWAKGAFTHSKAREREFFDSLNAEQQLQYFKAQDERERLADMALDLVE